MSRKKQTEQEKKAQAELLKNETVTDRTKRVLNPRINRVRKNIHDLTKAVNSPRYEFTVQQAEELVNILLEDIGNFENAIKGASEQEIEDIL